MKILLVCTGGISASVLLKKMKGYIEERGLDVEVISRGVEEIRAIQTPYDLILLGPQISYKRSEIEKLSNKTVLAISPNDYATGNIKSIFKQINLIFPFSG